MDARSLFFATYLIIANVWIAGAFVAGGPKAQYMAGIALGWLVVSVISKLTGK